MKRYVEEIVGEEYKQWNCGDRILVSTPTGSGKTTFVIDTLLRYAVQQNKHVVYYCNRKALNDQIVVRSEEKIRSLFKEEDDGISAENAMTYLHIYTYQNREKTAPHIGTRVYRIPIEEEKAEEAEEAEEVEETKDMLRPEELLYYVFDEAHYFIADAVLNEKTNQWLDLLTILDGSRNLKASICLFLTATPEPLYHFFNGKNFLNEQWQDSVHKALNMGKPRYEKYLEKNMQKFLEAFSDVVPNMPKTVKFVDDMKLGMKQIHPNSLVNLYERFGNPVSEGIFQKCYCEKPDYSYIQPVYFKKYEELLDEIKNTGTEKWLIFVDNEFEGMKFARFLEKNELKDVGVLSRDRIDQDEDVQEIYQEIVEEESFSQRILITTSVLDCGINIDDDEVSNIVIACDNKTGFLQMLGRKRMTENEKIRLFIKAYSYNAIRYRYNDYMKMLTVLNRLSLKNSTQEKWDESAGAYREVTYLTESELNMLSEDIKKMSQLTCDKEPIQGPKFKIKGHLLVQNIKTTNVEQVFPEYSYSRTAFLNIFTRMREYEEALSAYYIFGDGFYKLCEFAYFCFDRMTMQWGPAWAHPCSQEDWEEIIQRSKILKKFFLEKGICEFKKPIARDDSFYLKCQLAWIGKTYDEDCWLGHTEKEQSLREYLASREGTPMDSDAQSIFIQRCLQLIIHQPKIPDCLRTDVSRYVSGKLIPGKNRLNKCFQEMGIPYEITSVQKSVNGKRSTFWIVKKRDAGDKA